MNLCYNEFRARLLFEVTALDQRFPTSNNLKQLGAHTLKLANSCLLESTNTENPFNALNSDTKDELLRVIEYEKERLRVETSELARELRDAKDDLDSHLMVLESLQIQLSQIHSLDLQLKVSYKHSIIQRLNYLL